MTMSPGNLLRDYRAAFLRHLVRREETTRNAGYELGRAALEGGLTMLDVVCAHHEVLIEVLHEGPADESTLAASAAAEFLLEVLSSYDMAHRALTPDG